RRLRARPYSAVLLSAMGDERSPLSVPGCWLELPRTELRILPCKSDHAWDPCLQPFDHRIGKFAAGRQGRQQTLQLIQWAPILPRRSYAAITDFFQDKVREARTGNDRSSGIDETAHVPDRLGRSAAAANGIESNEHAETDVVLARPAVAFLHFWKQHNGREAFVLGIALVHISAHDVIRPACVEQHE